MKTNVNTGIVRIADEYQLAALKLRELDLNLPAITNAALSIEIYLKSLLKGSKYEVIPEFLEGITLYQRTVNDDNKKIKTHNFSALFDLLDENSRQILLASYEKQYLGQKLDANLTKFSNYFNESRYFYEDGVSQSLNLGIIEFSSEIKCLIYELLKS